MRPLEIFAYAAPLLLAVIAAGFAYRIRQQADRSAPSSAKDKP